MLPKVNLNCSVSLVILTKNSFWRKPSREPWNVGKELLKSIQICGKLLYRNYQRFCEWNATRSLLHSWYYHSHMFSGSKHYIGQSSGDLSGLTRAGSALRTHLRPGYKERRTGREWKGRKVRVYSLACGKLTWSAVTKTADQWSCRVNLPAWLMASRPSLLIHFKLTTFSATRIWFLCALLTKWRVEEVQGSSQFKMNTYRVYFSSMRHRSTKRQALETNPCLFCIL